MFLAETWEVAEDSRNAMDAKNIIVNLKALSVTSVAVDTCKLALAAVTLVRMQPNRGYVFLVPIASWSLGTKLIVVSASLVGYGLVFWAAAHDARKPIIAAAAIFVVAIGFRFLFMIEGALVVLQDSISNATIFTTAMLAGASKAVLGRTTDIPGHGVVHLSHDISDIQTANSAIIVPAPNLLAVVVRVLQVNIIHTCSVAVHVVFLLVIRKYLRCTRFKLRPEDMSYEART